MRHLILTSLLALAAAPAPAPPVTPAEPRVGRYESVGLGPVNVWWMETPNRGLIVIDTSRSAREAANAVERIKATGLPVRAILITHPHPDHVTGIATFKAAFPAAPVIAQAGTAGEMRANTQKLLAMEGAPLPPQPDRIVPDGRFTIDGLVIEARSLGAGESVAQTVYWLPDAKILFSADLATPRMVPFLKEGRTAAWLGELRALKAAYPADARVYPGHGGFGVVGSMVDAQTTYLTAYRTRIGGAIARSSPGGATVTPAELRTIITSMATDFRTQVGVAGLPLDKLDAWNAAGVAGELGAPQPGAQ